MILNSIRGNVYGAELPRIQALETETMAHGEFRSTGRSPKSKLMANLWALENTTNCTHALTMSHRL